MCDAFPHINMFMSGSCLYPVPVPFLNPVSQTPYYLLFKNATQILLLQQTFLILLDCLDALFPLWGHQGWKPPALADHDDNRLPELSHNRMSNKESKELPPKTNGEESG